MRFLFAVLMRISFCILLFLIFCGDFHCFPSRAYIAGEMCNMMRKNSVCGCCVGLISNFDPRGQIGEPPKIRTSMWFSKPLAPSENKCNGLRNAGCYSPSENYRIERWSWASAVVSEVKEFYAEDKCVMDTVNSRNDDLLNYLLREREIVEADQLKVRNGEVPGPVNRNDYIPVIIPSNAAVKRGHTHGMCEIRFSTVRQWSFCWPSCEGTLSLAERLRLWWFRLYLVCDVRNQLVSLQRGRTTVFCLLLELLLLGLVLKRCGVDRKTHLSALTPPPGGQRDSFAVPGVVRTATRRATQARTKGNPC
uniref:Uncharacterized protein TCIL3000_11_11600 n=1 Tax=Trypanosoma congolense (strain IL3000) TaxID=1068625 RepID=G0V1Z7_TRYCI|nr:unnamed protein product [Trypanosoma congolense IL3000]